MKKETWKVAVDGRGKSCNEIYSEILRTRGIDPKNASDFLEPSTYYLHPPSCFRNIVSAGNIFIDGIKNNKRFFIFADVDVDGCSSAAIIYHYLKAFDIDVVTYINKGKSHGIQEDFDFSTLSNIDIMIVVDSLNQNTEVYTKVLSMGVKLIVLDHHIPEQQVLNIEKEINLVSSALDDYPNHELTGSGVCWKFVSYIDSQCGLSIADTLVDLAAAGIIADCGDVSVNSMENRAICHLGFNSVQNVAMLEMLGKDTITSSDIGYGIAPLVNAANRQECNDLALKLFLSEKPSEIRIIIDELKKCREEQRVIVKELVKLAEPMYENQKEYNALVFFLPDCENLSGLVATQLVDKYGKPCIVLKGETDTEMSGSMRAVGLDDFRNIINESGYAIASGHPNSAGIVIKKDKLIDFLNYLERKLYGMTFEPRVDIDVVVEKAQLTPFLLEKLAKISRISGNGFGSAQVLIKDLENYAVKQMSGGKHLCVTHKDMKFLHWNFSKWEDVIEDGIFSAVGTVEESTFMGRKTLQMVVNDYLFENGQKVRLW